MIFRPTSYAIAIVLSAAAVTAQPTVDRATLGEFPYDFSPWPYPLYQAVEARLKALAAKHPNLARLHNIGKSREGRDLWVIEITNKATGPADAKPALWFDGNIHAGEVTGRQLLMYFVERTLGTYGKDPKVTRMVDTRTFYVMPVLDVDGAERVLTRHPAWPGHKPDQQSGRDLDGDGYITQMRVKDPNGTAYPSAIDPRVMLQVRDQTGGRWNFIPTTFEEPKTFEETLAPRDQRYRLYTEGVSLTREPTDEREPANYNRNWSAEWNAAEPGSGPFPFSLPEVYAVAKFLTDNRNIYFHYTIHSGGGAKNYIVRPPMSHPFEFMPPEDNDFYTRVGGVWSALTGGGVMNNNYYAQEVKAGRYGDTMTGFSNDWAYMQLGIHSLLPEISAAGRDYDGDGYVTQYEIMQWNDKEKGGKYFAPWKPYKHPELGDVEIGGSKGMPQGVDDRLKEESAIHFALLTHAAELAPELKVTDVRLARQPDGTFKATATLQNRGFLSTYVTRQALAIKRDEPIMARIAVEGGRVKGHAVQKVGHILGKLAYIRRWGAGADESTRVVEWSIQPTGPGPISVSVEAWAHKAGRDRGTGGASSSQQ
jgi:murein tripeptide amidase MpaA